MTPSGGPSAIKGFRLQTTYLLWRLLHGQPTEQFLPEGQEDLDIKNMQGHPTEHVQVKAYKDPLTLGDISTQDSSGPQAEKPYLQRALERIRANGTLERVVVFGTVGPELEKAWQGHTKEKQSVTRKLLDKGYTEEDLQLLFQRVVFEALSDDEQTRANKHLLQEGMGAGDPHHTHDALSYWLLEASEKQRTLTVQDLWEQVHRVGQDFTERQAFHQEWGRGLKPVKSDPLQHPDPEALRQELYEGVGARHQHIQAGVDVRRPVLLEQIHRAFQDENVVVLRGASGQGKSALAYRYLYEHAYHPFTFEVPRLRDSVQAEEVALALKSRLRNLKQTLWLLLDVRPGDSFWLDLLHHLQGLEDLRLLITIREEDWTRSQHTLAEIPHGLVPLKFTGEEAREMFDALGRVKPSKEFLTFDEAWRRFEERGPLLEFVFMVTHEGQHLQGRLQGQVRNLERLWEDQPEKLDFLHAAALAAAYHARVDTLRLAERCKLNPRTTKTVVTTLEREHLLRISQDDTTIEGLHPIRSALLLELLSSPETPKRQAFQHAMGALHEEDLEMFLLNALRHLNPEEVLEEATKLQPASWVGRVGVLRALIWWDVKLHLELNHTAILEAFKHFEFNWWAMLLLDVLGLQQHGLIPQLPDWKTESFVPERMKKTLREVEALVVNREGEMRHSRQWLTTPWTPATSPKTPLDWLSLAEVAFFTGLWDLPADSFEGLNLNSMLDLPLEEAAEVHYGLTFLKDERLEEERQSIRDQLLERFKKEAPIQHIEETPESIKIHFAVPFKTDPLVMVSEEDDSDLLMDATLRRLNILHHLLPHHKRYDSQGYGHEVALLPNILGLDGTRKTIKREHFVPAWGVRWNSTIHHLGNHPFLLKDWDAHAHHQYQRRLETVTALESITAGLPEDLKHLDKQSDFWMVQVFLEGLRVTVTKLDTQQELPLSAVDPWGLVNRSGVRSRKHHLRAAAGVLSRQFHSGQHDPYLKALRKYHSSIGNFFRQATFGLYAMALLKQPRDLDREKRFRRQHKNNLWGLHLSMVNLMDARERLPLFQQEFRSRFVHLIGEEALTSLESREKGVLDSLWASWGTVARVPNLHSVLPDVTVVETVQKHHQRLLKELDALRSQGLMVQQIQTDETWEDSHHTLWLQMDLPSVFDLHEAHMKVIGAIHRTLQPILRHNWTMSLLLHAWDTVVIVPTVKGKAWRMQAWVHSLALLMNKPDVKRWWLLPPRDMPEETLEKVGIQRWPMPEDPTRKDIQKLLGELFMRASRMADLERMRKLKGVDEKALDHLQEAEEVATREMLEGTQALALESQNLAVRTPQQANLIQRLLGSEKLWVENTPEQQLYLINPEPKDYQSANIWTVIVQWEAHLLEQEQAFIDQQDHTDQHTIDVTFTPSMEAGDD